MQLILWRHADAADASYGASYGSSTGGARGMADARQRDLARELTLRGEKQARRTAQWLRARLPADFDLLVSPAIRTVQTAQQLRGEFVRCNEIAPDVAPEALLHVAGWPDAASSRTVILVSHQPTLGRVASLLLTGRDQDLAFEKSAAWWFEPAPGAGSAEGTGNGVRGTGSAILRAVFDAALP